MIHEKDKKMIAVKTFFSRIGQAASVLFRRVIAWSFWEKLRWKNVYPKIKSFCEIIAAFTKAQPRTAAFIYVCLFAAFSIEFLDIPLAKTVLRADPNRFLSFMEDINPSGWWFPILGLVWIFFAVKAGLSLTTDAFEKNLTKARSIAFVLLALSLSSLVTIFFNILIGRYTPYFLGKMNLTGFSLFRFRISETSFPSFGVQSAWAIAVAFAFYYPKLKKLFYALAAVETLVLPLTAICFLSDAAIGAYIGIMMFFVARWVVSEGRENTPLFSR